MENNKGKEDLSDTSCPCSDGNISLDETSLEPFSSLSNIYIAHQLNIFPSFVKCENLGCYRKENDAVNKVWKTAEKFEKEITKELGKDSIFYIVKDYRKNYFEIGYDEKRVIQIWVEENKIK